MLPPKFAAAIRARRCRSFTARCSGIIIHDAILRHYSSFTPPEMLIATWRRAADIMPALPADAPLFFAFDISSPFRLQAHIARTRKENDAAHAYYARQTSKIMSSP